MRDLVPAKKNIIWFSKIILLGFFLIKIFFKGKVKKKVIFF